MVRGLELFREHFRQFADRYVLIGGVACDLSMRQAGLQFRATKDMDIVLCIESLDGQFARAFWEFVKSGGYMLRETSQDRRKFYRFQKPSRPDYPVMLELFSRVPDALAVAEGSHLSPIPIDDDISSLSAILLDDDYYYWTHSGKRQIDGLPVVDPEHLIPLKAKAWLDLRNRKASGQEIDGRSIQKHKNDIFRLFQIIDPQARLDTPSVIAQDMRSFIEQVAAEGVDLKSLGLRTTGLDTILEVLRRLYA